jgi:chemotaxis protein CheX
MVTTVSFEEVILEGAKEVFETMVFLPIERAAEPESPSGAPTFLATITFTGDLEGCFGISCSDPGVRNIAASMLCLEPGSTLQESEISDAIGEIANMVMGSIKTRVQHEIPNIAISIPSVIHGRQLENRLGEGMTRIKVPITIGQQHRGELSLLLRQRGN